MGGRLEGAGRFASCYHMPPVTSMCRHPLTCVQATQFTADLGFTKKRIALGFTKSNVSFWG